MGNIIKVVDLGRQLVRQSSPAMKNFGNKIMRGLGLARKTALIAGASASAAGTLGYLIGRKDDKSGVNSSINDCLDDVNSILIGQVDDANAGIIAGIQAKDESQRTDSEKKQLEDYNSRVKPATELVEFLQPWANIMMVDVSDLLDMISNVTIDGYVQNRNLHHEWIRSHSYRLASEDPVDIMEYLFHLGCVIGDSMAKDDRLNAFINALLAGHLMTTSFFSVDESAIRDIARIIAVATSNKSLSSDQTDCQMSLDYLGSKLSEDRDLVGAISIIK